MLLLQAVPTAPSPPPVLPASAPWWAFLLLGLAPIVVGAVVQIVLARRKTASLVRLHKDVASHGSTLTEHGATLAALKEHAAEPPEKTDPALVRERESARQALEQRVHKLEARADHADAEIKDIRAKMERRAEEDARADRELERELGRIAGMLEAHNGSGSGTRSRRG